MRLARVSSKASLDKTEAIDQILAAGNSSRSVKIVLSCGATAIMASADTAVQLLIKEVSTNLASKSAGQHDCAIHVSALVTQPAQMSNKCACVASRIAGHEVCNEYCC